MPAGSRIAFLDNLRTFTIFLVVVCHAGLVYESSGAGAWFWIVDDPATNDLCGLVNLVLDIFMMPILFFLSGYLAPASLRKRTAWAFIKAKAARLIVPWVVCVLTLIPLFKVVFLHSRGLPQEHWTTYFHVSNGIISQSWLWFLPVLFCFNVLYLLLSKARIKVPGLSLKTAVLGAFLIGFAYSVAIDTLGLRGWTKIGVLDFQNERLLIYLMVFLLGTLAFRQQVFDAKPEGKTLYIIANALAWVPVMAYISFLLYPWLHPGRFIVNEIADRLILWFSFQLALLCLMYLTIETFRRYLSRQGRLSQELGRNSYGVYLIHVIVTGGFATLMLNLAIPSVLKYAILAASTFVASHLIVSVVRRIPALSQLRFGPYAALPAEG